MKRPLLPVLLLCMASSAGAQTAPDAEDWGEPVEGVQLHLGLATSGPPVLPGELPALEVKIRNQGPSAVVIRPEAIRFARVEIDGIWYEQDVIIITSTAMPIVIAPGSQSDLGPLRLIASSMHEVSVRPARRPELIPGSHRIRIGNSMRLPVSDLRTATGKSSPELARRMAGKDVPALVSNTITIDVPELSVLLHAQQPPAAVQPLTLSLPRTVDPKTALIDYVFHIGEGTSGGWLGMRAGVFDYVIKPDAGLGPPGSLALRIYIPGYRMMTQEFTREELRTAITFVPPLVPLSTTTLKGRLIDSAGKPLTGEYLEFDYVFAELLGPGGGMTTSFRIADTTTDGDGRFEIDVPSLLDDPFFENTSSPGYFEIVNDHDIRGIDFTLHPSTLHVQKNYELLTITKSRKGTLGGRLGALFLDQNDVREQSGLEVKVTPSGSGTTIPTIRQSDFGARRPVNPVPTFSAPIASDGRFNIQVPAGRYDVRLWVPGGNRFIPVESGVVVEEDRRTRIDER